MFGPNTVHKVRGKGKHTKPHENIVWRAHPVTMNEIRNLSIQFGGQKNKASMNAMITLLVELALHDKRIMSQLYQRFAPPESPEITWTFGESK